MDTKEEDLLLLEYSSSKLCHDLAGTIGGITNSIEFLDNKNLDLKEHAESLLKRSSKQLVDQFQFFRKLYGYMDNNLGGVLYNLLEFAENYLQYQKIQLTFDEKVIKNANDNINGLEAKIIINIIYLISKCCISGGKIEFAINKDNSMEFSLKSKNLKFDPLIKEIVNDNDIKMPLNASTAQMIYTQKLIHSRRLKFSLYSQDSSEIKFKLTKF